jgi:hypothetical protein
VRSRRASALLVAALALAGCGGGDDDGGGGAAAGGGGGGGGGSEALVDLAELGGSGQTGTATLTASGGSTAVTVETVSYLVDPQPAAIAKGTCAKPGAAEHELATIEDGISVTTVDASLDDLRSGGYVVTVSKSRTQPDVLVACGAIE